MNNNKVKLLSFNIVLFYVFLFTLLYFEDRVYIFDVSLSNIWKSIAVFVFFLFVFNKKLDVLKLTVLFLSISFLINGHGLLTIDDIEEVVIILILPISYYSFYYLNKFNPIKLKKNLLLLSSFLILTTIPFLLKIITPVNNLSYSLDDFGQKYQFKDTIMIGFFKHPSISSKVFAFSLIVIWVLGIKDFKNKGLYNYFFIFVIALGLLDIYLSFTRTGWVMLLIFVLIFIFMDTTKTKINKIVFFSLIISSLFYVYISNQSIQNRIIGNTVYSGNIVPDLTSVTSGRNIIIYYYISSVLDENTSTFFLGLGKKYALRKNHGALAHNRIVEIFAYGGLVSMILYFLYLFLVFKEIHKYKTNSLIYFLSYGAYMIMIISLIPSHGLPIWANVIFGGIIALNRIEFEISKKNILKP